MKMIGCYCTMKGRRKKSASRTPICSTLRPIPVVPCSLEYSAPVEHLGEARSGAIREGSRNSLLIATRLSHVTFSLPLDSYRAVKGGSRATTAGRLPNCAA